MLFFHSPISSQYQHNFCPPIRYGSYTEELDPYLVTEAWILECEAWLGTFIGYIITRIYDREDMDPIKGRTFRYHWRNFCCEIHIYITRIERSKNHSGMRDKIKLTLKAGIVTMTKLWHHATMQTRGDASWSQNGFFGWNMILHSFLPIVKATKKRSTPEITSHSLRN